MLSRQQFQIAEISLGQFNARQHRSPADDVFVLFVGHQQICQSSAVWLYQLRYGFVMSSHLASFLQVGRIQVRSGPRFVSFCFSVRVS